jgi:hypothetical protein
MMVDFRNSVFVFAGALALAVVTTHAEARHGEEKHEHAHDEDEHHDDEHHDDHEHHDHEHHDDEHHEDEHRAHGTHVHGTWELFAALDDAQLSVTVKGPIVDVLGFERPPADETERAVLREVKDRLDTPETMLSLSDRAGCALSGPVQIKLPEGYSSETPKEDDPEQQSHDHDHGERTDGEHHADHDIHASDLEVSYVFECGSPARLAEITVNGFSSFSAIENVDAVFLGDGTQAARRLVRNAQTLKIE